MLNIVTIVPVATLIRLGPAAVCAAIIATVFPMAHMLPRQINANIIYSIDVLIVKNSWRSAARQAKVNPIRRVLIIPKRAINPPIKNARTKTATGTANKIKPEN